MSDRPKDDDAQDGDSGVAGPDAPVDNLDPPVEPRCRRTREGGTGYCDPPRHSQFKPGQSGYPGGRPKGRKSLQQIWAEEMAAPMRVNGEDVPATRVLMRRARQMAAKGDLGAIKFVFSQLPRELEAGPRRISYEEYMECMSRTLTQDDVKSINGIREMFSIYQNNDLDRPWPDDIEIEARQEFSRRYEYYIDEYNIRVRPDERA